MARSLVTAFLALVAASTATVAQGQQSAQTPDRAAVIAAARELIGKARYGALVTVGPDGQPQSRIVDAFAPESDMTVWIATNPVTRKIREIRQDPRVTLSYVEPTGSGYVTLLGRARIVDDPAEKAARWKEDWTSFYRDRNRGPDYILIEVRPSRLEIVSYGHKLLNDPATWRPTSIDFPSNAGAKGSAVPKHAVGTFEVKLAPQATAHGEDVKLLGRMALDKRFRGDLDGSSQGEMLTAGTAASGSAGYVAIERVTATLHGRKGTFILQHSGTMTRGRTQLTVSVVPDSGTGELSGLAGTMAIVIEGPKHSYDFEYTLPDER